MRKIGISIVMLVSLLLSQLLSGQDITVKASLDTNSLKIGEQTMLTLEAENPSTKLVWPEINDTLTAKIQVLEISGKDTMANKKDKQFTVRQQYRITSFDSGYHVIPPFHFVHQQDSFFTEALLLEVKTVKVDTTKSIKGIKDIREEPLHWKDVLPWIGIGLMVIAIILAILYFLRRRKPLTDSARVEEKPSLPPYDEAITRLQELEKQQLWQKDQIKAYYVELTAIVRHYIERRYAVEAEELTSRETIKQLEELIEEESLEALSGLLQRADMVKFARYKPVKDEHELSQQQAIQFVELTHQAYTNQERKNQTET
ncbi:MAG: hypothetical protein ACQESZ_00420 [Bacteroidota bacterium]